MQSAGGGNGVLNIGGHASERKGSIGGLAGGGGIRIGGDEIRDKARAEWNEGASNGRSSVLEGKEGEAFGSAPLPPALPAAAAAGAGGRGYEGVKVTIDREIDYQGRQ